MAEVVDAAEKALLSDSDVEIYQRISLLVRVTRDHAHRIKGVQRPRRAPMIAHIPDPHLREQLSRCAWWFRTDKNGNVSRVLPPTWSVQALAARARWAFPYLEAVTEAPALRADGSILDRPGYDEASGLLYEPNAEYPLIPEKPSKRDVEVSVRDLLEPFDEFPFVSVSDKAAALATILTLVVVPVFSAIFFRVPSS